MQGGREPTTVGRLQAWLAAVHAPDDQAIRDHAERITERRNPHVVTALVDAAMALGLATPPAYVSSGVKAVGVRAYEKPTPFLLLGSSHLDDESGRGLSVAGIRFAVGAELTHLRFGHTRATSREFGEGVFRKTTNALAFAATFGGPLGSVATGLFGKRNTYAAIRTFVPLDVLKRIYRVDDGRKTIKAVTGNLGALFSVAATSAESVTARVGGALGSGSPSQQDEGVGTRNEELLAALRFFQLTADRAGLLLAGDIGASIIAMFALDPLYANEIAAAERVGLAACLSRRDSEGNLLFQDLALRCAALIFFYLSEEYEDLRAALGG